MPVSGHGEGPTTVQDATVVKPNELTGVESQLDHRLRRGEHLSEAGVGAVELR